MHHAEHRPVLADECDVDGELGIARDELARAVERIHQPELGPVLPLRVGHGGRLFGQHRDRRCQARKAREDHALRAQIRFGER